MKNFIAFRSRCIIIYNFLRFLINLRLKCTIFELLVNFSLFICISIFFHASQTLIYWFAVVWSVVVYDLRLKSTTLHVFLCFYLFKYSSFLCFYSLVSQVIKKIFLLLLARIIAFWSRWGLHYVEVMFALCWVFIFKSAFRFLLVLTTSSIRFWLSFRLFWC